MLAMAVAGGAAAQEMRGGVDVSLGAEVISNPYLAQVDTGAAAAATMEVRPWLRESDGLTAFDLRGYARLRQYSRYHGLEDDYGASAGISHRANERLTLSGNARLSSTVSRGGFAAIVPPDSIGTPGGGVGVPPPPGPIDEIFDPDVTLLGQRGRATTISAGMGASYIMDERHSGGVNFHFRDASYDVPGAQEYQSYGASAHVTRILNERTNIGTEVSYTKTDYAGPGSGDAESIVAFGTLSHRMDEVWTLQASAGAAFTQTDPTPAIPRRKVTTLATNASLCRRYSEGSFCLGYSRLPQPTGYGGVRTTDALSMNYSRRLSERDSVSATVGYSHVGAAAALVGNRFGKVEYVSASAMFSRVFNERLSGFVRTTSHRSFYSGRTVDPSVSLSAGVTVRLGRTR